jgi:hypothetical protein
MVYDVFKAVLLTMRTFEHDTDPGKDIKHRFKIVVVGMLEFWHLLTDGGVYGLPPVFCCCLTLLVF